MTTTRRTGAAQPAGLRERKRRETHRLLAATALRLVAERGLDRVTVEDISGSAGVSPRTFFNYFASKEDALLLPYPDHAERSALSVARVVSAPPSLSPLQAVVRAWREDLECIDADREEWVTRLTVMTDHVSLLSRLIALEADDERRMIEALTRRTGLPPEDPYPALVYCVAEGAVRSCLAHWHRIGGARSVVRLVEEAVDAVAEGLPVPD
ncbi:TetR/AcrR family transcriptional regulator [Streptomyces jumonjinensis]|uniref:TetR family transcriptional regulator n=1 Tax=Streptomyces jumonjinensis TaxID=1945 RepID=A0A646KMJ7_STRJU|nr:TetR family transcriptional regulator [Streptomyces jumonjinensis]MQT03267.1 TetR family transcriptional regulator [Streptomyces jumonjinensis]